MTTLQLKKFDMKNIRPDSVVVLIGKRNTGKSFLVKDLLFHLRDIPVGTVISGTEGATQFYTEIIPKLFIHDEYTPQLISNVMKRQKKVITRIQKGENQIDPRAFLILDDCLYDNSWKKDKNIRSCFMNGRHYKLLFIITMQYALGIGPNLRTNIDYVFILRENYVSNRKRLYENYAGMFPTFDMFSSTMDQCTSNYECLVIDNTSTSNKIDDQVYWYKADPHANFTVGAEIFWRHSENNSKDAEESSDDEFDPNNWRPKRRGPELTIKKL